MLKNERRNLPSGSVKKQKKVQQWEGKQQQERQEKEQQSLTGVG